MGRLKSCRRAGRGAVSLRLASEAAKVAESHKLLQMAGAMAHMGHWRIDLAMGLLTLSAEAGRILNLPQGEQRLSEVTRKGYHPEDRGIVEESIAAAQAGSAFRFEARIPLPDGTNRHVVTQGQPERSAGGAVSGIFGIVQDVTEQMRADLALKENEERYRRLAENATDIVLELDRFGICWHVSPSVLGITGFAPEELIGQDLAAIIHPDDQQAVRNANLSVLRGEAVEAVTTYRTPNKNGRWLWLETHLTADRDPVTGDIIGLIGSARDVGERKRLEAEILAAKERAEDVAARMYELATTDELTGLANRRHFLAQLEHEIARHERTSEAVSVAMFDIDFFKRINDVHGHDGGDAVLRFVAHTAAAALRATDVIGRLGGEEFGVIMPACDVDAAEEVCERLREAVSSAVVDLPSGKAGYATISIGVAELIEGEGAERVLKRADQALYAAKSGGRNCLKLAA